ncbi:MAG: hypothetical protein HY900_29625 [Deltaproteobacteria bacterium]|nr:hypothetical protein [Deltaproteobacteria bacterium]
MGELRERECACESCGNEAELTITCESEPGGFELAGVSSAAPEESRECYYWGTEAALLDPE